LGGEAEAWILAGGVKESPSRRSALKTASFGSTLGPLVFGWMFVGHRIAVAAYGVGLAQTVEDTYAPTFLTAGMLCVVARLLSLFIGRSALSGGRPTALPSAAPTKA
jgi:hypothetical protein